MSRQMLDDQMERIRRIPATETTPATVTLYPSWVPIQLGCSQRELAERVYAVACEFLEDLPDAEPETEITLLEEETSD